MKIILLLIVIFLCALLALGTLISFFPQAYPEDYPSPQLSLIDSVEHRV
jgi:hypothetical protein